MSRLTSIIAGLLLLTSVLWPDEEKISENEKKITAKRAEIFEVIQRIQQDIETANKYFTEADNETSALRSEARQKDGFLQKALVVAAKSANISRENLTKARNLRQLADDKFKAHDYRACLENLEYATRLIATNPVVSLKLEPRTISNKFIDMTFEIDFATKSLAKSWQLNIVKVDQGDETRLMSFKGDGEPGSTIKWNGKSNDEFLLDSASTYYAELLLTDTQNKTGSSGRIEFITDIFVRTARNRGLLIDVSSIRFERKKADIAEEYQPIIKKVYTFLHKFPGYTVIVEGHADFGGRASYNKRLSEERAEAVMNELIKLGLLASRTASYGLGESLPKTLYVEKRALNRRVVFLLVKNEAEHEKYKAFYKALDFKKEIQMKETDEATKEE